MCVTMVHLDIASVDRLILKNMEILLLLCVFYVNQSLNRLDEEIEILQAETWMNIVFRQYSIIPSGDAQGHNKNCSTAVCAGLVLFALGQMLLGLSTSHLICTR